MLPRWTSATSTGAAVGPSFTFFFLPSPFPFLAMSRPATTIPATTTAAADHSHQRRRGFTVQASIGTSNLGSCIRRPPWSAARSAPRSASNAHADRQDNSLTSRVAGGLRRSGGAGSVPGVLEQRAGLFHRHRPQRVHVRIGALVETTEAAVAQLAPDRGRVER